MHVHILTMVWDQKRGDWNLHRGAHISKQLCKSDEADMESQENMHTCNDAYTCPVQDMGPH